MKKRQLIVGNWKMNGSTAGNSALMQGLAAGMGQAPCDVAVCPPMVYLAQIKTLIEAMPGDCGPVRLGVQDVSEHLAGAYTGDVEAQMLRDFDVRFAIVGHSERRKYQGESDVQVALKAKRALAAGITPIVCVGESAQERQSDMTEFIVKRQLSAVIHLVGPCVSEIVVAYEPIWAIGTGLTATPEQAQAVHAVLRAQLRAATERFERVRIVYGGSMNAGNAAQLLAQPDIDGGLIGGASLKAKDFLSIVAACAQ